MNRPGPSATAPPIEASTAEVSGVLERAERILVVHCEGVDGWCGGCLSEFGVWTFHPCSLVNWASRLQVAETGAVEPGLDPQSTPLTASNTEVSS